MGAADSRDGWLRPLGAAGPGSLEGVAGLEDLGAGTAEEWRESRATNGLAPSPSALQRVSAITAARPQCPRHGAPGLAAGTPFLRPH